MEGYTKVVLIMMALALVTVAQNGSDAQMCDMTADGFNDCKPAVAMEDPSPPCKECCDAIQGADLKCLCTFANSPILKSLKINKAAALDLPISCKVDPKFHCQDN